MTKIAEPNYIPGGYTPDDYELEAIAAIVREKVDWEEGAVFVTRKEQYLMRRVIEQARRYYAGIFDSPYDEITGEKKTWVHLTKWSVENVVKSIDLDTKDVLILPNHRDAVNFAPIVRASVLQLFKKIDFGQLLNDLTRVMARDGTVVVKTYIEKDESTKKDKIKSEIVNLLNFYIDPSARTVQESATIERSEMSQAQLDLYKNTWTNTEFAPFTRNVARIADIYNTSGTGEMPYTEIWERWGQIKKSWITKKESDENTWVEGHIVTSGLGQPQVIHLIRENPRKDGRKPYEECWYRRQDGRWHGEGVGEMLFYSQEYVNTVVNIRMANNIVLQNGIFLIRKGSGISPDMLNSITAGGGLAVTNINNDVKQLNVQDFRASSYQDEDRVYLMADRVTGSFDIGRGEAGQPSASATATLTRDRNIRDTFVLVQEGIGFFIERLIVKQYIPLLQKTMKPGDIVKVTGDAQDLSVIDDMIINNRANDFISKHIVKTGYYPNPEDLDTFKARQRLYLRKQGRQRFVEYFSNLFNADIDIEVHVTDEKFNRVVAVQQLREALMAFSRLPNASRLNTDAILKEMFSIMGLKGEFFMDRLQPAIAPTSEGAPRRQKEFPQEVPSEVTAFENASGLPQQQPIQGVPGLGQI